MVIIHAPVPQGGTIRDSAPRGLIFRTIKALKPRSFTWKKTYLASTFLFYFLSFSFVFGVRHSIAPGTSFAKAESPYRHTEIIEQLIQCESRGRNVKNVDVNGYYSYGVLQFQSSTWNGWSATSGIIGSPMNVEDAMRMADWAIDNGYLGRWSCARKLGLLE